jgi:nitrate/TMAO reductase-like tetraheme cytochrome c subunit
MRPRRVVATIAVGTAIVLLAIIAHFVVRVAARERPAMAAATVHATLTREDCVTCHAPIAAEWRESFHHRSPTGPFWERVRRKAFGDLFEALRVPCMNCHAPANVLDLPLGAHPAERTEAPEMGVDCVSCHVSTRGVVGGGRPLEAPHEVIPDERFRDPARASTELCAHCHNEESDHARVVEEWQDTPFAAAGVTCLHCHMPVVEAPVVTDGPRRRRRSHRFPGDKEPAMLRQALNAEIVVRQRSAVVRVTNDRVGHSLPASGMNTLIVRVEVRNEAERTVAMTERHFGTRELVPGYLDFWPFQMVSKIPYGESREVAVALPPGEGRIVAEFRYRDWFAVRDRDVPIATLSRRYGPPESTPGAAR